jgi:NADPH:quinone reductase-like Zn-dependent oxidoreductase
MDPLAACLILIHALGPTSVTPPERQTMSFRVLIAGGAGQVGSALERALLAAGACTGVVMVNRRTIPVAALPSRGLATMIQS